MLLLAKFGVTKIEEELSKFETSMEIYEYSEFHSYITWSAREEIENEGDMLEVFLSGSAKETPVVEHYK